MANLHFGDAWGTEIWIYKPVGPACVFLFLSWWRWDLLIWRHGMETLSSLLTHFIRNLTMAMDSLQKLDFWCVFVCRAEYGFLYRVVCPGSAFIKPDQRNPWIKDQIKITLLPTISHLLLPNFVSCGRACPSHMTQNLVTVGAKLWTADRFIADPWSMDYADPVW